MVEYMFSLEQSLAILGDPALGDRLERLAFNALPGTFTDHMWAHQYDPSALIDSKNNGGGSWRLSRLETLNSERLPLDGDSRCRSCPPSTSPDYFGFLRLVRILLTFRL